MADLRTSSRAACPLHRHQLWRRALLLSAVALVVTLRAASAAAAPEITSFTAGLSDLTAGAHADANVRFSFATEPASGPGGQPDGCFLPGGCQVVRGGAPKEIVVTLPKGMVGSTLATPTCTLADLTANVCSADAQVGIVYVGLIVAGSAEAPLPQPVYNLPPAYGEVARFGFRAQGAVNSLISVRVGSGPDYRLTATVRNIFSGWPVWSVDMTLWGVPADAAHDPERVCDFVLGCSSRITPKPFLSNPTECGVDGNAELAVTSWADPDGAPARAASQPQQLTGCDQLRFEPSLTVTANGSSPGQPFGLGVTIDVPQTYDTPAGRASPALRDAVVTLPEGVAISSSSWWGLEGCSDAQLHLTDTRPADCPDGSRIGDVTLRTPLIGDLLTGGVYLRSQASSNPESGDLFRIAFEVANAARGVSIKIAGRIHVDAVTGRVTARFADNPPLPFDHLALRFKSGPRAPVSLPVACGTATTTAALTGWGTTAAVQLESALQVGSSSPCLFGFTPSFVAGTANPAAGASSPFTLRFGRDDDDQELSSIAVDTPTGFSGTIADVQLCPEGQAAAGTCPVAARIGNAMTSVGPGPTPPFLTGDVFLTGPYHGAPFGLSIVVRALAGPFDLGTVVVRSAVFVDRTTAQLRIVSDRLPTIVKGVPLRIRAVVVTVDRPGFVRNPTSCQTKRVEGTVRSVQGAAVSVASRFQAASCGSLPFTPKMQLRVGKRGRTRSGITTPLQVSLTMPSGQANNRTVQVTLPRTLNSRLQVLNRYTCSPAQLEADGCTASVGSATAVTPLLRDPLRGPVYLVANPGRSVPDLVVRLRGQVDVDLVGHVTIPPDLTIRTTFDDVPDVPITSFRLNLVAGRRGPIGVIDNLCSPRVRRASVARLAFRAQSGRRVQRRQRMRIAGCARTLKK